MCSIFGAFGTPQAHVLEALRAAAGDRGRDGGRSEVYVAPDGKVGVLGNWRAIPTPEVERAPLQPYDGVVHNGTIANDKELGAVEGEVDSMVLPRILDRANAATLAHTLAKVRGSYAVGVWNGESVLLGCNYKPIHYYRDHDTIYFSSMARHLKVLTEYGHAPIQVPAYSTLDLRTRQVAPIPRQYGPRAVVICSAGLDSTTVAWLLASQGYEVCLLHFLYRARAERRESALIGKLAARLGCQYAYLPLDYRSMSGGSPLLEYSADIADGVAGAEWAHEWVPARNLVMLALATAYAEANGYHVVALGNNLEEAGSYPDNEEHFTTLFDGLLPYATRDGYRVSLVAPVGHLMKHEIVAKGLALGVPYELTWSCYRGEAAHCGHCGPCFMRKTAFERNGARDPVFTLEALDVAAH